MKTQAKPDNNRKLAAVEINEILARRKLSGSTSTEAFLGNEFEKITKVRLPFDRRHPDGSKNYGIHGLDVWFILKGPKGAVQFAVNFGVYLPHVETELKAKPSQWPRETISGFDVGYHAYEPQYEGQTPMDNCDLNGGRPCYYDGSSLRADEWVKEIFSVRGESPEKLLWEKLEEEYRYRFEGGEVLQ